MSQILGHVLLEISLFFYWLQNKCRLVEFFVFYWEKTQPTKLHVIQHG